MNTFALIPGAVIASKIKEWTNVLSSTRLSQIVDMYYSNRGIGYNSTYKSCNRFLLYADLLESVELHEQVGILWKTSQFV